MVLNVTFTSTQNPMIDPVQQQVIYCAYQGPPSSYLFPFPIRVSTSSSERQGKPQNVPSLPQLVALKRLVD
jgi:hypothetical protein